MRPILGSVVAIAAVVILARVGALAPLEAVITRAGGATAPLAGKAASADETAALRAEIARLRETERENQELRALVNFKKNSRHALVPAQIVGAPRDPGMRAWFINRGTAHGVTTGIGVLSPEGILIGSVSAVESTRSVALLLTDRQSMIAAAVQSIAGANGLLVGERGGSMRLTLIPRDATLSPGMTVVTSGLEENIPRGILIGTIAEVLRDDREPFQSARIAPVGETDATVIGLLIKNP